MRMCLVLLIGFRMRRTAATRRRCTLRSMFELLQRWTPDETVQQRILVTNPAKLYGFPN
jgi:predicted TIM-barrel fold metal-dependent hydrolase